MGIQCNRSIFPALDNWAQDLSSLAIKYLALAFNENDYLDSALTIAMLNFYLISISMKYKTLIVGIACATSAVINYANAGTVDVYTSRSTDLIKPLLERFTEDTGIKTRLITGKPAALIERIQAEGSNTPADILLTTDAGNLVNAANKGLLRATPSDVLNAAVPAKLRDNDNRWFALTKRARIVVRSLDRVAANAVQHYTDLAKPEWKGKICIRSSSNIYNQSFVAAFISHSGRQAAKTWATAVVKNFARNPKGNDRAQIMGIAEGVCDLALVNTYYLAIMKTNTTDLAQFEASKKVAAVFTDQDGRGVHINISGGGVVKNADNPTEALALLEYMVTEKAQQWYAQVNNEYPVLASVEPSEIVKSLGYPLVADTATAMQQLGGLNSEAVRVMDEAGWK